MTHHHEHGPGYGSGVFGTIYHALHRATSGQTGDPTITAVSRIGVLLFFIVVVGPALFTIPPSVLLIIGAFAAIRAVRWARRKGYLRW